MWWETLPSLHPDFEPSRVITPLSRRTCRASAKLPDAAPGGMLLHSSQVPRGEARDEAQPEPSMEAQEQAETLAEEIMGIDESEGDLPLPLYLAGEPPAAVREWRACDCCRSCRNIRSRAQGRQPPATCCFMAGSYRRVLQGKSCGSCRPKVEACQADGPPQMLKKSLRQHLQIQTSLLTQWVMPRLLGATLLAVLQRTHPAEKMTARRWLLCVRLTGTLLTGSCSPLIW